VKQLNNARALLIGTTILVTTIVPAMAQDAGTQVPGGLRFSLGLEERLQVTSNESLSIPSSGTTSAAITGLSFGIVSETATQSFTMDGGFNLRLARLADGSTDTSLDSPRLSFGYTREAANAAFSAGLSFQRTRLEDIAITAAPGDPNATPGDITDVQGGGNRDDLTASARLDLGTSSDVGGSLEASFLRQTYKDTVDPGLNDVDTASVKATGRYQFTERTEGTVTLGVVREDTKDAVSSVKQTDSLTFGVNHALSSATQLYTDLGFSVVHNDTVTTSTKTNAVSGRVGMRHVMVDGSIDLWLGAVDSDIDTVVIGGLVWRRDFATGQLTASVIRSASADAKDQSTQASLGYQQDLSAVSSFGVDVSYADLRNLGENDVKSTQIQARYTHALTEDWNLDFGINERIRKEATVGTARSQSVFVSLNRKFDW
jgi:hypothetical protein